MLIYRGILNSIFYVSIAFLLVLPVETWSQISTDDINSIHSAVPFLTIAADSRAGEMGDVGVATSPDMNSQHWNPAKYAFMEGSGGVSMAHTPWLKALIPGINLTYLAGYKRIDDKQVVSGSLRYFSLGEIIFTDIYGGSEVPYNPNEFAVDLGYSRLFTDKFSGAMVFRYIRSDLLGNSSGVEDAKAGTSVAADLSFFYTDKIDLLDKNGTLSFGSNISNMGRKISYTDTQDAAFIPTNLRLGGSLLVDIDDYNSFTFALDLNKMLVPTPQVYNDSTESRYDPNVAVPMGMIQSFYDAPGGFKEELHEIMIGTGVEYWYKNEFAVRSGYFHEHATKGNRKYFTFGVGLKLNIFELDFSYLVPTYSTSPLANTMRFTLGFDFDKVKKN